MWISLRTLLVYIIFACLSDSYVAIRINKARSRTCTTGDFVNNFLYYKRGSLLIVECYSGFKLFGSRILECSNGKWIDSKPVCATTGCTNNFVQPEHGQILVKKYDAEIMCSEDYILAGNRISYCNGTNWDRPLGNCRLKSTKPKHECDFETEDLCGWFAVPVESHQWKRQIAINAFGSFLTGPTHDHTTLSANGGHYMLMESLKQEGFNVPLISPIYNKELSMKTACCFRFYYFMYGQGVGELSVYIKPVSIVWEMLKNREDYLKFKKSGSQGMLWIEETFTIPEMSEDFQIVFIATSSRNHLSDIAIDDVKLMIGSECTNSTATTTASSESDELEETTPKIMAAFDSESCQNRCFVRSKSGIENRNGTLYLLCSCHLGCGSTCCADFRSECLGYDTSSSPLMNISLPSTLNTTSTTKRVITPTPTSKTTTTTTTTTQKPTTTSTTTSSTTSTVTATNTKKQTSATTSTQAQKPTTEKSTKATSTPSTSTTATKSSVKPQLSANATNGTRSISSDFKPNNSGKSSWKYEPKTEENGSQKQIFLEVMLVLVILSVILICAVSSAKTNIKSLYNSWKDRGVGEEASETAKYNKNSDDTNSVRVRLFNWNKNHQNNMNLPLVEAIEDDGNV